MPKPPTRSRAIVAAIGVKTTYWDALVREIPDLWCLNFCIDVRKALGKEWDEDTRGSGYDACVRERMKQKESWNVVWQVATHILHAFGILLVFCNHGKHRSLSLAVELKEQTHCELVAHYATHFRDRIDEHEFARRLRPRLMEHMERFQRLPHPLKDLSVCRHAFDGPRWVKDNNYEAHFDDGELHTTQVGDIVMELAVYHGDSAGWAFGIVISGTRASGPMWYPPTCVESAQGAGDHYSRWLRQLKHSLVCSLV